MLLGTAFHSSGAATANDLFRKSWICMWITSSDVVQILVPDALLMFHNHLL